MCFPVNFEKFLKTPFLTEHVGGWFWRNNEGILILCKSNETQGTFLLQVEEAATEVFYKKDVRKNFESLF